MTDSSVTTAVDGRLTAPRQRAAALADVIADRLSDPDEVTAGTGIQMADGEIERGWWGPPSLGRGLAGIALLFSSSEGRALENPGRGVETAHRHLRQASSFLNNMPYRSLGLFNDVSGLAFALETARQSMGGYGKALSQLDREIAHRTTLLRDAIDPNSPAEIAQFDVISGLTGIGRYLLMRGDELADRPRDELTGVLATLVQMVLRTPAPGSSPSRDTQSGLWCKGGPSAASLIPPDGAGHGHFNFGYAHGMTGPLALLSLAHEQGRTVKDLPEAVERLAELLQTWVLRDEYGPYWPTHVSHQEWVSGRAYARHRGRASWCYGVPGVSRALQLAGTSFRRTDWLSLADESVSGLLAAPLSDWGISDMGLCHGWAGTLHLLRFFQDGALDRRVRTVRDDLAELITDSFDPDLTFGYSVPINHSQTAAQTSVSLPGFLEGAAGIALALNSYAYDGTESPDWEAALLVA